MAKNLRHTYYQAKVDQLHSADQQSWWRRVRGFLNLSEGKAFHCLQQQLPTGVSLADAINDFFASVSADLPILTDDILQNLSNDYSDLFVIDVETVENRLMSIDLNKSPGPDNIPSWVLRDSAPFLSQPVCAVYNASVREGFFPDCWKSAEVIPVPKVRPPCSLQNDLRPISLLPVLAKVLESIVGEWMLETLRPSIDPCQFGALKDRSTAHALISVLHEWASALDAGGSVRAVFVDFRKAFDHVDHNLLISKMMARNVPHCLVKWFHAYLSCRKQRVRVDGEISGWLDLRGGMPQGSWLGLLSFLVLIDDLKLPCRVHKYVDDTTLTEILNSVPCTTAMDTFLFQLQTWTDLNHMAINFTKTKEMLFGPLSRSSLQSLSIGNNTIERVAQFKLLGVHVSNDLRWNIHVDKICAKASSRLYFLKQLKRAGLAPDQLLHFYLSVVRPVLEYCSVVWHHGLTKSQSEQIKAVQKRAIRIIYPLTSAMSYQLALSYADIPPLHSRRVHLNKSFFLNIFHPTSCLHSLLPPPRETDVIARLRSAPRYPVPRSRTDRYRSFIHYSLAHYQPR